MDKVCPLCKAALQKTSAEKTFKPLGAGKKDKVDPIEREQYSCGAVLLRNRQYPDGIIEASCCTASAD